MPTEKIVNYTDDMVKVLLAHVPFNHEKAKEFSVTLGRGTQSIVAKLKRLEADESVKGERPFYIAKEAYVSKTGKPAEKKSDIVKNIEALLGVDNNTFKGLDKAAKAPLEKVRESILALHHDVDRLDTLLILESDRRLVANEAAEAAEVDACKAESADDLDKAHDLIKEDEDRQDAECGGYADDVTKGSSED